MHPGNPVHRRPGGELDISLLLGIGSFLFIPKKAPEGAPEQHGKTYRKDKKDYTTVGRSSEILKYA